MTLNRWKVLACTLTVGVGGLAVFATPPAPNKPEPAREPAPLPNLTVKPTSPANGTDTPAPAKPATTTEFDLVLPDPVVTPTAPVKAPAPTRPATEPEFEPIGPPAAPLILPAGGELKDTPKPEETKAPEKPPTVVLPPAVKPEVKDVPRLDVPALEIPKVETPKVPVRTDLVPPPPVATPPAPPVMTPAPSPTPPAPPAPDSLKLTLSPTKGTASQPGRLKMLLRMGDGQPRFEIRNTTTTELLLKVYGEKIEMQAPPDARSSLAGVTASGRVRFTAPGLEGTCEHLTILSGTGEVLLKGNIHLKSKRGKAWSEMTAEKLVYQIGSTGLAATGARNPVTPASYIPD